MRSRLSLALLWCVLFILGGIAGWIGHCLYQKQTRTQEAVSGQSSKAQEIQEIMDAMARELELDEGQRDALKAIFDESRTHYRALNREFKPRYEAIRDDSDDKIRIILHGSQKARFEEMLKKYRPQKRSSQ